jgi:hypothetical protein
MRRNSCLVVRDAECPYLRARLLERAGKAATRPRQRPERSVTSQLSTQALSLSGTVTDGVAIRWRWA